MRSKKGRSKRSCTIPPSGKHGMNTGGLHCSTLQCVHVTKRRNTMNYLTRGQGKEVAVAIALMFEEGQLPMPGD